VGYALKKLGKFRGKDLVSRVHKKRRQSWALLAVPMASSNCGKLHTNSPEGAPATRSTATMEHKRGAVSVGNSVSS